MTRLAVDGGVPVRATMLPYGKQQIVEEDIAAVINVLRSDWLTTGPIVEAFEKAIAKQANCRFAVAFSSGTAALHGAVFAAALGPGDEAITTPLTFAATANCLLYQGATPVFADIFNDTLSIDPEQIKRRLTPRTKAIIPVDYAGHPAALSEIRELAEKHHLVVIEDGAHALGATYRERSVGSINEMTMFSFHPVKHITTGEGGAIVTNDEELSKRLRIFRNQGINSEAGHRQERGDWYYEMVALGYNYRLTDIGCALGLSQLQRLDANLKRRREIAAFYSNAFSGFPGVILPVQKSHVQHAWHLYPVRFEVTPIANRTAIFRAFRAENIGVNVHYIPVHLQPYYKTRFGYRGGEYPIAEAAYESMISLPLFHAMTDQDVQDVVAAMRKIVWAFYS